MHYSEGQLQNVGHLQSQSQTQTAMSIADSLWVRSGSLGLLLLSENSNSFNNKKTEGKDHHGVIRFQHNQLWMTK